MSAWQLPSSYVNRSVSEATLRTEDLIPAFAGVVAEAVNLLQKQQAPENAWLLERLRDISGQADALGEAAERLDTDWPDIRDDIWKHEDVTYFLNETLFDVLNEITPEGCTFGSSEGDGASFGFWSYPCESCGWDAGDDAYPHNEQCVRCGEPRDAHIDSTALGDDSDYCRDSQDGDTFEMCQDAPPSPGVIVELPSTEA